MVTGSFFPSDLFSLYNVVQNTQIIHSKELIISKLREYFSKDTKYHYVGDEWGFPKVIDHTDLPPSAGFYDDEVTRIYIGQENKFDARMYPAILVKHTSGTYVPISFNQEEECIQYGYRLFIDGYGNKYDLQIPVGLIFAGAWDLGFDIDILTIGPQDRSALSECVSLLFQTIFLKEMRDCGLFIKSTRLSGESSEIYQNDPIYKQTISLECRGEFRRLIPVDNIVEVISVCAEFGRYIDTVWTPAENMRINYEQDITTAILSVT